jgi:uncharacterized repeat protein (TIGR01451 family)
MIDVNLPAFGADPMHKDIFIEIDWQGPPPLAASIAALKQAFAAAPVDAGGVPNPDGLPGINLWIDTGSLTDSSGALVGDNLGGGNAITGGPTVCDMDSSGGPFYAQKAANFNSNRRLVFRYAIRIAGCPSSPGGRGELGGNDFVVVNAGAFEAPTIMHELGHNLGLRHGGFEDHNCKPNYVSVMNYDHPAGIPQTGGAGQIGVDSDGDGVNDTFFNLDYSPPRFPGGRSSASLPALLETGLSELGFILDPQDTLNQFIYTDAAGQKVRVPLAGLDFDGDGVRDGIDLNADTDALDAGLSVNLDTTDSAGNPDPDCANGVLASTAAEALRPWDDWSNIALGFRQFGDRADAPVNLAHPDVTDPTDAEILRYIRALNTTDVGIEIADLPDPVAAGTELTYTLTVRNFGPNPAGLVRVVQTLQSDVDFASASAGCEAIGSTVTCNLGELLPGETRTLTVSVNVPADLVYANGGPKDITSSASVDNLAGLDPNPGNDSASATTRVVAVADLNITSFNPVSPPELIIIGQPLDVTLRKTVANGGPSSPMDAMLTKSASASSGASVSPTTASEQVTALAVVSPQTVDETYELRCSEPGPHTFEFTNEIRPVNNADTDPNSSNNTAQVHLTLDCVVPVAINIKPGDYPNSINLAEASVAVAVLTTRAGEYGLPLPFDATSILPLTARFGPRDAALAGMGATEIHGQGHPEDCFELDARERRRDGDTDLLLHFDAGASGLASGDTEACVKGSFVDAATGMIFGFFGCDAIRIMP